MGWLRKKAKQIGNVFKKIGKKLKKGLGKIAKAFGKLGPLGSLALSFILPGIGSAIGGWLGVGGAGANTIFGSIFRGIKFVGSKVSGAFGKVWNTVSGAIEGGLNKIGNVFSAGSDIGTGLRNWVGEVVNGKETLVDGEVVTEATGEIVDGVAGEIAEEAAGKVTDEVTAKVTEEVAGKVTEEVVADTVVDKTKDSIFTTLKDKELSFKDRITSSKEYAAYKPIEATRSAGAQINAAEEAAEAQEAFLADRKSDYFKGQADIQQSSLRQQNFSNSLEQPQFVNFADFNPDQDPASQYLAYRGIQSTVNPTDVGGYGFDYEAFLRAQLGGRAYG
jgi:hypothetical protein